MGEIDVVFFDIGDTLGAVNPATGIFEPFSDSARLLAGVQQKFGIRNGIITTLGHMTNLEAYSMLETAGLTDHLDRKLLISEHDSGFAKPAAEIFRYAASKSGAPIHRCLFVGESLLEVIGAQNAGMKAVLKPCLR